MSTKPLIGSIVRRHGAWHWRFYEDGKQKSVKLAECSDEFRTKKDAVRLANERAAHMTLDQPRSGNILITEFADQEYFPHVKAERRPATHNGYLKIYETHLRSHFGKRRLSEYRAHHATEFLTALARDGMGRHAVNHVRSVLSALFKHAVRKGRLAHNPIAFAGTLVQPAAPKHGPRNENSRYTPNEITAILAALQSQPTARLVMALGFYAGLRTSEIAGLQWRDIEPDCTAFRVERSVWRGKVADCKNENSKRTIPVMSPLYKLLWDYRESQTILEPEQFVFVNSNRGPLDLNFLSRRIIKPILKKLRLPWKGYYAGRRALSTLLANSGDAGQQAAMDMLGHANINTTRTYYIGTIKESTLSEVKRLETALIQAEKTAVRDNKGQILEVISASN